MASRRCVAPPVPGHKGIELAGRVTWETAQNVGEPGLGVDVVEFGGVDQAVDDGGALTAAI